ncbi:MAG: outer membrane lipoprotein-sorting protein [Verrucomicrobia bacterium]|nr:outer membrane lipoprotein-sorting protein [Verrucomicrobiota bacterium]
MNLWCFLGVLLLAGTGAVFAQDSAAAAATITGAAYPPIANPELAGRELAGRLRASPPARNTEFNGVLRILARDAAPREVPVACRLRIHAAAPGGPAWEAVYRTGAAPGASPEVLVVRFQAGQSNRYAHARGEAASMPPDTLPAVSGAGLLTALAGSDFWLCDLGLEFLHWPGQRVIKTEMRRGQVCRVLESRQPVASPGAYARVLSWVARPGSEGEGIIQAEAYNAQDRLVKEFSLGSFKKVEGQWQLKDMKIVNVLTRSRTWLEFDLNL